MSETWRVIDDAGAEHAATVEVRDGDDATAITVAIGSHSHRDAYHRATPIRAAIAHRAWAADIAVAEILAPGQQSRAEACVASRRIGVRAGLDHAAARLRRESSREGDAYDVAAKFVDTLRVREVTL